MHSFEFQQHIHNYLCVLTLNGECSMHAWLEHMRGHQCLRVEANRAWLWSLPIINIKFLQHSGQHPKSNMLKSWYSSSIRETPPHGQWTLTLFRIGIWTSYFGCSKYVCVYFPRYLYPSIIHNEQKPCFISRLYMKTPT